MKVKKADAVARFASDLNVRGSEQTQQMMAEMTAKVMVHWLWFVIVLRYLALTAYVLDVSMLIMTRLTKHVKRLNKRIIQDEHDRGRVPRPSLSPK